MIISVLSAYFLKISPYIRPIQGSERALPGEQIMLDKKAKKIIIKIWMKN